MKKSKSVLRREDWYIIKKRQFVRTLYTAHGDFKSKLINQDVNMHAQSKKSKPLYNLE